MLSLAASFQRFGVRLCENSTVLLTGVFSGDFDVQKQNPVSTKMASSTKTQ